MKTLAIVFLLLALVAACAPTPTPTVTPTPTSTTAIPTDTPVPPTATHTPEPTETLTPTPTRTPVPGLWYGINRVPQNEIPFVRENVGGDIIEVTTGDVSATGVTTALDAAQASGYKAVLNLTASTATDRPWYLDASGEWVFPQGAIEALGAAGQHPALFAVYSLHEPFSRAYFIPVEKQYECTALIKQYSGGAAVYSEVSRLVGTPRKPEDFRDGLCNYCGIGAHLFRTDWSSEQSLDAMRDRIDEDLAIQRERMPNSQLVFGIQTFGRTSTGHRMPTPDELRAIRDYACGRGVPVQYYPWTHGSYTTTLKDAPDLWTTIQEGCGR